MNSKNIIWGLTIVGCMFSCTAKFDDYNTNHNVTNKVTPAMLATDMLLNIYEAEMNGNISERERDLLIRYLNHKLNSLNNDN